MKKTVLVTIYILFHLFVLREIRTNMFAWQTQTFVSDGVPQIEEVSINNLGTRLVYIEYETEDFQKIWHYKFPFGFFFLLGMIGLILIGSNKNFYLILTAIHLIVAIIAGFIFYYLIDQSVWWLAVCDMLSRYFIPLASIGIIPLSFLEKRNLLHEEKAP
ncbi:hypothetical protein [Gracilimonas halophila]|uniref:Uncharacterized protein n=1 Tax=Gracilimonas halophila TaxID=1834464 RepID=A0ABW5JL97_9BACT